MAPSGGCFTNPPWHNAMPQEGPSTPSMADEVSPIVFLPSGRCSSRTWPCAARYSEVATTSPRALVAVGAPCVASLRQAKGWSGRMPSRRTARLTVTPGS